MKAIDQKTSPLAKPLAAAICVCAVLAPSSSQAAVLTLNIGQALRNLRDTGANSSFNTADDPWPDQPVVLTNVPIANYLVGVPSGFFADVGADTFSISVDLGDDGDGEFGDRSTNSQFTLQSGDTSGAPLSDGTTVTFTFSNAYRARVSGNGSVRSGEGINYSSPSGGAFTIFGAMNGVSLTDNPGTADDFLLSNVGAQVSVSYYWQTTGPVTSLSITSFGTSDSNFLGLSLDVPLSMDVTPVPEPSAFGLMGMAALAVIGRRRRA